MLEAGDDLRFITRRLCILASEDVGLADPMALVIAQNAAAAVDRVGMPEASIILGEAVIYLADRGPKATGAYLAIAAAQKNVREGSLLEVPSHLRNDGEGYVYPHDSPARLVRRRPTFQKCAASTSPASSARSSASKSASNGLWKRFSSEDETEKK